MIALTRLNGSRFAVNSDLIERIDAAPDTVLTLVDGTKYVVSEGLDEVIESIRAFRASVVAVSGNDPVVEHHHATLRVVTNAEEG